jgi:hypothetical protein
MRFDVVALSQQLEQADAVDRARGARDAATGDSSAAEVCAALRP